jgi:hypothetical protein
MSQFQVGMLRDLGSVVPANLHNDVIVVSTCTAPQVPTVASFQLDWGCTQICYDPVGPISVLHPLRASRAMRGYCRSLCIGSGQVV